MSLRRLGFDLRRVNGTQVIRLITVRPGLAPEDTGHSILWATSRALTEREIVRSGGIFEAGDRVWIFGDIELADDGSQSPRPGDTIYEDDSALGTFDAQGQGWEIITAKLDSGGVAWSCTCRAIAPATANGLRPGPDGQLVSGDLLRVDGREQVVLSNSAGSVLATLTAVPGALSAEEAASLGGLFGQCSKMWRLPGVGLPATRRPVPGDRITDQGGTVWQVISADRDALGATWNCNCLETR